MTSDIPPPPLPGDGQPPPAYPSYPQPQSGQQPPPPYSGYDAGGAVPAYPQVVEQGDAAVPRPPSIERAVMLMRLGAVLSVVSLLVGLATLGSLKDNIKQRLVDNGSYSQSDLDNAYNIAIVSLVIATVLSVGLWLWMASANGNGRKWARVVATALGALGVIGLLISLAQGQAPTLSIIVSAITVLLAIVIVVLLWRKESTAFYQARSRPSYA